MKHPSANAETHPDVEKQTWGGLKPKIAQALRKLADLIDPREMKKFRPSTPTAIQVKARKKK